MDLPADNRRIPAEPPLEEIPRKHDGGSIRTIFALGEGSPDGRIHSQQRKQVPASAARLTSSGNSPVLSCQVELPVAPRRHVFKTVGLRAPVVVVAGATEL
jgi:hypothetical protein